MIETMHTDSRGGLPDSYRTVAQDIMEHADRKDGIWQRFERGEMHDN